VSIFEELFNSGARHRADEKNRHEWMRDDPGDSDPHRGPVDLDSGAVQIRIAPQVADGEPDDDAVS
jgi:hypothetical protein